MTKFVSKVSLVALAVTAAGFGATAANAATAQGTARAAILENVTVTQARELNFGAVVPGAAASNVAVNQAGVATCGAGLTCSGPTTSGQFNVTGSTGYTVTVASDASVSLTNGGGGTMTASLTPSAATLLLSGAGTGSFTVAGSLGVGANQAVGNYVGTYNVTVNYQ